MNIIIVKMPHGTYRNSVITVHRMLGLLDNDAALNVSRTRAISPAIYRMIDGMSFFNSVTCLR